MEDPEKSYLARIQTSIESFGQIQRDFILEKNGVVTIINFIKNVEGSHPELGLKDPVMQKGRQAALSMIENLEGELFHLKEMNPPEVWKKFHDNLICSLELQIEGYGEMVKVFEDNDIRHIGRGRDIVSKGMSLLEGGPQVIQGGS
ncbi:MAG: hypothetical protein AB2L14_04745 [Candidatus Xenobiia bacterium LiM19]